jgi:hypothetical protein
MLMLPPPQFPLLLNAAFGTTGAERPEDALAVKAHTRNEMDKVESLYAGAGRGLNEVQIKGTAWAAYNAVVEYVDYYRNSKGKDTATRADNRLNSSWFGSGAIIKERAWNYLTDLVK